MEDKKQIFALNKSLEDLDGEEWRNVRNNQFYYISNLGRAKSRNCHQMIILSQQKNNYGYWRVCMSLEKGKPRYYLVSRLVAEAFSDSEIQEHDEVHHTKSKDCNTADSLVCLSKEAHSQEHDRLREQKRTEKDGEE